MASGMSKEIKSLLKNAKEAIKNKEYKEALKHCKVVLKQDKGNYNALVFVGVAAAEMEQPDQARMAYKKAIESEPNQILAWQGLCGFYEKRDNPEYKTELVDVYIKMMAIYQDTDKNKWKDIAVKLANLHTQLGNDLKNVDVWQQVATKADLDDSNHQEAWKNVSTVLLSLKSLPTEYTELLEQALETIVHCIPDSSTEHEQWYQKYIKNLFDNYAFDQNADKLEAECTKMAAMYSSSTFPTETLCKFYLQRAQDIGSDKAMKVYSLLQDKDPTSAMATIGTGYIKLTNKSYIAARELLQQGVNSNSSFIFGWYYLCKSQWYLHDDNGVEKSATQGLKLLKRENTLPPEMQKNLQYELNCMLCESLVNTKQPNQVNRAIEIYKKLLDEESTKIVILLGLCKAYLTIDDVEKAKEYIQTAASIDSHQYSVLAMEGWIEFLQDNYPEAETKLLQAIEIAKDEGLFYYQLGRVYWQMDKQMRLDKNKCFNNFLKAAKLDPYHSDTFLYLGHYYQMIAVDTNKAKRCYQKSFDLDRRNDEAGAALGDALIALGEEDTALALYTSVTSKASAGSVKWAWLRLGLYQLKQRDCTQAVTSFQNALRADPKDVCCWQCLAEAYMTRGSHTAALKAFTRASELDPTSVYCHFQIAAIKQTLGLLSEAVSEYKVILDTSANYVPALKGIGETYTSLARLARTEFFNGRVVDYITESIKHLARAVKNRPDVSCLWKLLGDASTLIHCIDKELVRIGVPQILVERGSKDVSLDTMVTMEKIQVLSLGAKCYGRALSLKPECSSLWHDLGINYYRQAQEISDDKDGPELAHKSLKCLQKAITIETSSHQHWNALGVVAASKYVKKSKMAQHAFIKSIHAENNNVIAWTNLGTLYLSHHQIELAHKAFKVAQSLEPSYVACWIGQALVAENIGSEESMDLFRHTTELGTHLEGSLGYAHWVCHTIFDKKIDKTSELYKYNIVQMGAATSAAVSIGKYTDRRHDNPTADNIHGLLLEHEGSYRPAAKIFERAVHILKQNDNKTQLNMALSNYGRMLCTIGNHEEATKQYQAISPLTDFHDVCGLAVALYKNNKLKESYQAYEQALQLASTTSDKSNVLAAMGMVAYKFKDADRAKTLLFKCSQLSPPCTEGILALCSLGLQQGDFTLASAALAELLKLGDDEKFSVDVSFMTACLYALQGSYSTARNQILKAIHKYPWRAKLWQQASKFIIQFMPDKAKSAVKCGQIATSQDFTVSKNDSSLAMAQLAAGQHSQRDSNNNSLKTAQKMVHLYPGELHNWAQLSASCYADERRCKAIKLKTNFDNNLNVKLAQFVSQQASNSGEVKGQGLHQWATKQTIDSMIQSGQYEKVQDLIQSSKSLYTSQPQLLSQLELMNAKMVICQKGTSSLGESELEVIRNAVVKESTSTHAWQMLAEVYKSQGMIVAAETCYRQSLQVAKSAKTVPLIRLAYLALTLAVASSDNKEKWTVLCQEATTEALKLDPQCTAALLMQGILHCNAKNQRQAKRSLQQVMSHGGDHSLSLARFYLMKVYLDKKDQDAVQELLNEAKMSADPGHELLLKLIESSSK
ncbi:tetratricopeptide repeat protein 37-like isoform X1 [Glandiceps talaboti]